MSSSPDGATVWVSPSRSVLIVNSLKSTVCLS